MAQESVLRSVKKATTTAFLEPRLAKHTSDLHSIDNLEMEKLKLEREKLEFARKSWWVDLIAKVGIPASVLLLSVVTYYTGRESAENRLRFEKDIAHSELQRKDRELFLRSNELSRNSARMKGEFVEKHSALILSDKPQDRDLIEQYIISSFEHNDQPFMRMQVEAIRKSGRLEKSDPRESAFSTVMRTTPTSGSYVELGQQAVKDKKFEDAELAFKLHLTANPHDAATWNYLAYAQLRAGHLKDARESISTAIRHQPQELKVRQFVALNAAKILCAAGDAEEGINYVNTAAQVIPGLKLMANNDGELRNRCAAR
ncbi:hypothetical protein ACOTB6_21270 [Achromobacter xylosoxidans]